MTEEKITNGTPYRVLHSSDWHLGAQLAGRRRHDEQAAFLDWLAGTLRREAVDCLVVAGDIFDTTVPTNQAQRLLYDFLVKIARGGACRHVVLVAGNHDSVSFLEAPRQLLGALDIHVVAQIGEGPEDDVFVLDDAAGRPALIVGAVPYLRDRDMRRQAAGETAADKERLLLEGIEAHYAKIGQQAEALRRAELERSGRRLPILLTGHLFAAGGQTATDDGVRELYVGSLGRVPREVFPAAADYVALGHLHAAQTVAGDPTVRYSGAPLAVGFGEAGRERAVCRVDFAENSIEVEMIQVPVFQRLARIEGDLGQLQQELETLVAGGESVLVELRYTGEAIVPDLAARMAEIVEGSGVELLRVINTRVLAQLLPVGGAGLELGELEPAEVFEHCLEENDVPEEQREELRLCFAEIVAARQALDAGDSDATS
ncbi:MAG: exonuclease SbcCD subunit D C-terminal domain-containing protein [Bacillota bacterium]|nr:exonuclease SbcCD subunit D C-terminal domain-containing protein [Bacillota bacterium]